MYKEYNIIASEDIAAYLNTLPGTLSHLIPLQGIVKIIMREDDAVKSPRKKTQIVKEQE